MAELMLTLADGPRHYARAMRMFAANPNLFEKMLAMHVGEFCPAQWAAAGVSLGARMLFG
jgi:hypothetical protein